MNRTFTTYQEYRDAYFKPEPPEDETPEQIGERLAEVVIGSCRIVEIKENEK